MRELTLVGLVAASITFGGTINLSTGFANWQVSSTPGTGTGGVLPVVTPPANFTTATILTTLQDNGTWATAPTGSSWISWGSVQGTSCVVGQTPGNGCANTLSNPSGDLFAYTLLLTSAQLGGATSGTLNFVFGADNRVFLDVGNEAALVWNGGSNTNGTGFNPLGCSASIPTSAGNTQATYNTCTTTVSFNSGDLSGGNLNLTAYVFNDPIPSCLACGDPTGFVLSGNLSTVTPEPATFGLVGGAVLFLFTFRRELLRASGNRRAALRSPGC